MYIGYERIDCDATVKTVSAAAIAAAILARATHVELQADGDNVKYTMDNTTDPSGALPRGMTLDLDMEPKLFLVEDFRRIRFTRATGNCGLNVHYIGGRDV